MLCVELARGPTLSEIPASAFSLLPWSKLSSPSGKRSVTYPRLRAVVLLASRAPGRGSGAPATSSEGEQSVVVSSVGALEPGAPDRNLAA